MRTLVVAMLFGACGNVQDVSDAGPGDGGARGFTLSLVTSSPAVPLGGQATIALQVTRSAEFTGDVTIAGMNPPPGLTVSGDTVPASETLGAITVGGAAPLAIDGRITFSVEATADGADTQTLVIDQALVTGRPGSLDTSFGPNTGVASITLGSDDDGHFNQLDVINGNVLAVGESTGGLGAQRFISMRFTSAGVADPTWNAGAVLRTAFTGSSGESSHAFATGTQTDGRSISIGHNNNTNNGDIAVARYSATGGSGGVDFGDGSGKSLVNLGGTETVADGLVLASNQIVAVGSRNAQLFVARLTSTGLLDTTFNSPTGYATATLGTSSQATNVITDANDRLIVAGSFNAGSESDVFVRRYSPAGALDGFGGNNGVIISGADSEVAVGLGLVGDKVLVASQAGTSLGGRIRVRRYDPSGTLDQTFGTGGVAEYTGPGQAVDMAVLPDGRIVVLANNGGQATVVRFTAAGAIDLLFGNTNDGTSTITIGDNGVPACLSVYSSHLIVIGGGNVGGVPGPGTYGIVARMWM